MKRRFDVPNPYLRHLEGAPVQCRYRLLGQTLTHTKMLLDTPNADLKVIALSEFLDLVGDLVSSLRTLRRRSRRGRLDSISEVVALLAQRELADLRLSFPTRDAATNATVAVLV